MMADEEPVVNADKSVSMGANVAAGAAAGTSVLPGWGTVIGAGAGLLGSMLSDSSSRDQASKGYAQQREALQNSIQWRVADAKKAGIHPLYALGAPSMNIAPITYDPKVGNAIGEMGQSWANTVRGQQTSIDKAMEFQNYRAIAAQADKSEAEADYYRGLAHKTWQDKSVTPAPNGLGVQHEMGQNPQPAGQGMIDLKAAENISNKTGQQGIAAGKNPYYEMRMMDNGLPFIAPLAQGDSMEETLNEMSFPAYAGLLMRNAEHFGPGWLKDFVKSRYFGQSPEHNYRIDKKYQKPQPTHDYFGRKLNK